MTTWTQEIIDRISTLREKGLTFDEIGHLLNKSAGQVRSALYLARKKQGYPPTERTVPKGEFSGDIETILEELSMPQEQLEKLDEVVKCKTLLSIPAIALRDQLYEAELDTANIEKLQKDLKDLQERNSKLARIIDKLTRIDKPEIGGVLTLRASDHHYGDHNHLLACGRDLAEQFLDKVADYKPCKIQIIAGDDFVAGQGIYRNQELDVTVPSAEVQVKYGATKAYELIAAIRSITDAPICWYWMKGNHDQASGLPLSGLLRLTVENLCSDIPNLTITVERDVAVINLAHTGTYNVLVRHGTGYSRFAPNSNSFISDTKDELLSRNMVVPIEERCQRVLSGHTHWLALGVEHIVGIKWDTTGGLQRNSRVKLGCNQRPPGWAVYIGVRDVDGLVLEPIALTPARDIYKAEIASTNLVLQNMEDMTKTLHDYAERLEELGIAVGLSQQGYNSDGR